MGSRTPARPPLLRPGWVWLRPPQVRPAWPALPDQIFPAELPHKHKHRICLAGWSAFSSLTRGKSGEVIKQSPWPQRNNGGPKFSCEPRQGAGFTNRRCVSKVGNTEKENNAQGWSLAQAVPQFSSQDPQWVGEAGPKEGAQVGP